MMMIAERLKDLEHRVERLEHEADEFLSARSALKQLVGDWATRLTDAMTNPTVNWPEIHRVVDAMHEFGRRKTDK